MTDAHWNQRAGGILGTLTLFPQGVTSAADRQRGLVDAGSDRLSIRYVPIGEEGQVRGPDGALDVLQWGISHVASVGEPADVQAGDELGTGDGFNLEVEVHWLPEEEDMTTLQIDPQVLADAVAAGVRAARVDEPEPDRLQTMLAVVATQPELYNGQALGRLALAVAAGTITDPDALQRGLEDALIPHTPSAPGLTDGPGHGAGYATLLADWWGGKSLKGDAWRYSESILDASEVSSLAAPGAIPLPLASIADMRQNLVSTTATTSAGDAILEMAQAIYDKSVRDPLDLWDQTTVLPGGSGEVKLTEVTLPTPTFVAEPTTDSGYARTGDATADANLLKPKLLIAYLNISRLMDVSAPEFWTAVAMMSEVAMMERLNQGLLETINTDAPVGMYNFTGVGTSANLTTDPDVDAVDAALGASLYLPEGNRRMVVQNGVWRSLQGTARVAGVSPLVQPTPGPYGSIDDVPLLVSKLWTDAKPYRGIVGPWQDIISRLWDGALYVSRRYEAGVNWLLLEAFADWRPRHAGQFHRFRQD